MINNHSITIRCTEDIDTLAYFSNLAKQYEDKTYKNDYEKAISKQAYDIIPRIIDVKNGYVVLDDMTIRCSESVSWFVAQYDGCKESEMHSGYNAAIMGY